MTSAWLDASIVLRFITRDVPTQALRARSLFAEAAAGDRRLRLASLAVAEVVWTLMSFYELDRDEVADRVSDLVAADGIEAEEREVVLNALRSMKESKVSFIDAYLAEKARASGEAVCSFDRDFDRLGVERLS